MAENAPQRHFLVFRKLVFRHFPRAQLRINVRVQGQLAFLNQMQCPECRNRLADGPGLEEG